MAVGVAASPAVGVVVLLVRVMLGWVLVSVVVLSWVVLACVMDSVLLAARVLG